MGHTAERYLKPQRNQSLAAAYDYIHLLLIIPYAASSCCSSKFEHFILSLMFSIMMPAEKKNQ